jgi:hypothetical protein
MAGLKEHFADRESPTSYAPHFHLTLPKVSLADTMVNFCDQRERFTWSKETWRYGVPELLRGCRPRRCRKLMSTVQDFSEKERAYHACQVRHSFVRQQKTIRRRPDDLTTEAARERAENEAALAEIEQPKTRLKDASAD